MILFLKFLVDIMNNDEKGQSLIEYVILIAFIAMVAYAGFLLFGPALSNTYQEVIDSL